MAPVTINPQVVVVEVLEREFPRIAHPNAPPDVDDVFVIVVSIGVVASLTIFVLIQAVSAVKSILETSSGSSGLYALPSFRKKTLLPDGRTSPFLGPHRCQFTLSPERYDTDTDSSSTLTRSSSSDSTVVGGRICVVYDDTEELNGVRDAEEDGDDCALTFAEPRPRVRRELHWQQQQGTIDNNPPSELTPLLLPKRYRR